MTKIDMKKWNDEALLVVAEETNDENMKKYIKTILVDRYADSVSILDLYKKIRANKNIRNDILWSSITAKLVKEGLFEINLIADVMNDMPMDYIVYVYILSPNVYIKYLAYKIGHEKQEEYEK